MRLPPRRHPPVALASPLRRDLPPDSMLAWAGPVTPGAQEPAGDRRKSHRPMQRPRKRLQQTPLHAAADATAAGEDAGGERPLRRPRIDGRAKAAGSAPPRLPNSGGRSDDGGTTHVRK